MVLTNLRHRFAEWCEQYRLWRHGDYLQGEVLIERIERMTRR